MKEQDREGGSRNVVESVSRDYVVVSRELCILKRFGHRASSVLEILSLHYLCGVLLF